MNSVKLISCAMGILPAMLVWSSTVVADEPSSDMGKSLQFWAFESPRRSEVPETLDTLWPQSDIDRFVLAKLEASGMHASPLVDKRTLLRRATFDLTGLPPTLPETDAFLSDDSPDAYSRLVERLLASPHYGERWGRHWLDAARYADTKGYVYSDREETRFVHSSSYRDWVIRAFNDDLPYDQFLLYQIAGDQVRNEEGQRPLEAMGFLTLGQRFANVRQEIINDRIDVITRATMALTVTCARCHDHPADPISMADYYSLYGVLAGSRERMQSIEPDAESSVSGRRLSTEAFVMWEKELRKREKAYQDYFQQKTAELLKNLRANTPAYLVAVLKAGKLPPDEFYQVLGKDDIRPFLVRRWERYIHQKKFRQGIHPIFGAWHAFAAIPQSELAARAPVWLNTHLKRLNPRVAEVFDGKPLASMSDVAKRYGEVFGQVLERSKPAEQNKANSRADPADEALRQVLYGADSPIAAPTGSFSEIEWFYEETVRVGLGQKWREIERWIIQSEDASPHAVFMEDQPLQREPRIFERGNPAVPGAVVPRRTLLIVGGEDRRPFTKGSGRLELAQSIVNPNNPLTARVLVNRVWQHHFGAGLVSTPSNFGHHGGRPSHPALLDWLARRFVEDGWSIKKLHRRIMLSKSYTQGSADNGAFRLKDPKNRLLWRMSRRRLDFEALRDSILAVSGNLNRRIGGRPVQITSRPYSTRRTVYGIVNRLSLPGMYRTFDFASPDEHSPRRQRTTVPQQALYFMNSAFVIEQARALAARPNIIGEKDPTRRIQILYRSVYGRDPSEKEISHGLRYLTSKSQWDRYAQALMMTNEFMFLD